MTGEEPPVPRATADRSRTNDELPQAVFFANSRPQADDALSVAECLNLRSWIVPMWSAVEEHVRSKGLPANMTVLSLASALPPRLQKLALAWRGVRLIRRVRRRKPLPVFVFGDDLNQYQTVMLAFLRKRNLPTLLIQDGLLDRKDPERIVESARAVTRAGLGLLRLLKVLPPLNRYYGSGGCRSIAVYGPSTAELMLEQGVPTDAIQITGSPRHDRYFDACSTARDRDSSRPLILCIGTLLSARSWGARRDDIEWIRAVNDLALTNPRYRVILRPHPSESVEDYSSILGEFARNAVAIDKGSDFAALLRESDAVIMVFPSSVLLEALILRKPVVRLDLGLQSFDAETAGDDLCSTIDDPALLDQAVARALAESVGQEQWEKREAGLLRHVGFTDGRNSQRVASLIHELYGSPAAR